jgi:hypothetical protein
MSFKVLQTLDKLITGTTVGSLERQGPQRKKSTDLVKLRRKFLVQILTIEGLASAAVLGILGVFVIDFLRRRTWLLFAIAYCLEAMAEHIMLLLTPSMAKTKSSSGVFQLNRFIYISWFVNVVVVVAATVILSVISLDAVQTAFCVYMFVFCTTCAVLVWTKPSWNVFCLSVIVPGGQFMLLVHLIWNCEAAFGGLKVVMACGLVVVTRFMRIGGSRLLHTLIDTPKTWVQVTTVQYLMVASMVLLISLHLAFPSYESISFVEIVLWGCFLVDGLWHFRAWKMDLKRAFLTTETLNKIVSKKNVSLKILNDVKRRQVISTTVGVLVVETLFCVYVVLANSVLGLQEENNECTRRSSRGSDRLAVILFPLVLASLIAFWMMIYAHVTSERRDKLKTVVPHPVLQESSLISQADSTCS